MFPWPDRGRVECSRVVGIRAGPGHSREMPQGRYRSRQATPNHSSSRIADGAMMDALTKRIGSGRWRCYGDAEMPHLARPVRRRQGGVRCQREDDVVSEETSTLCFSYGQPHGSFGSCSDNGLREISARLPTRRVDRVPARGVRALRSTRLPAGRAGTFRLPRWAA